MADTEKDRKLERVIDLLEQLLSRLPAGAKADLKAQINLFQEPKTKKAGIHSDIVDLLSVSPQAPLPMMEIVRRLSSKHITSNPSSVWYSLTHNPELFMQTSDGRWRLVETLSKEGNLK